MERTGDSLQLDFSLYHEHTTCVSFLYFSFHFCNCSLDPAMSTAASTPLPTPSLTVYRRWEIATTTGEGGSRGKSFPLSFLVTASGRPRFPPNLIYRERKCRSTVDEGGKRVSGKICTRKCFREGLSFLSISRRSAICKEVHQG